MKYNNGVHTLESHLINVNKLCRVCGKRAKKYNDRRETAKDCKYYGEQILYYYGIDTESDNPLTHSTKICEQCYSHFHNYSKEQTVPQHLLTTFSDRVTSSRFLWQICDENIDEDSCSVCSHCKEQNKGGRPKKAKRGRKARNVQDDVNPLHQESLEFQPNMCSTPQRTQRSSGVSNDLGLGDQKCSQFSCESSPLLLHGDQSSSAVYNPSPTERPVPAHCEMLPASSTSDVHLEQKGSSSTWICTSNPDIQAHAFAYQETFETPKKRRKLDTSAEISLSENVSASNVASSTTSCSLCTFKSATIEECLAKKKSDQLSREEEKLFTWLAKRKLYNSKDRSILKCKTGGQPIIFHRVPTARKSADVKSPLKKRRAKVVEKVCRQMTGGDEETEIKQYAKLYKRMPATKKDKLFHLTGCKRKVVVNRKTGLAMKSLCGLTTMQYRLQRKILRKSGITFASECSEQKELQEHIVQDSIVVEDRQLFFTDESSATGQSLKETPVVYVRDLCSFVSDLLDKYSEQQLLDFHDGKIPEDQIWVKIGGDHGGDSFKLCLQIVNVKSPNSRHNTFMVTMFNGKDTAENLRRALWHYRHQVYKLKKLKWMGKCIKVFLFGDYDFQCKVFGLSGAAGTHPCLWCYTTKRQMQKAPETQPAIQERTLRGMRRDYRKISERRRKQEKGSSMQQCHQLSSH